MLLDMIDELRHDYSTQKYHSVRLLKEAGSAPKYPG